MASLYILFEHPLPSLEHDANALEVSRLMTFFGEKPYEAVPLGTPVDQIPPTSWFEPDAGLKKVRDLTRRLAEIPPEWVEDEQGVQGLEAQLAQWKKALETASGQGARWCYAVGF